MKSRNITAKTKTQTNAKQEDEISSTELDDGPDGNGGGGGGLVGIIGSLSGVSARASGG